MDRRHTILVVSDIHYGGGAERQRGNYEVDAIPGGFQRTAVRLYRHFIWMRHPFAHNQMLDRFIAEAADADLVVANGDYSCDSAFVGVSDDAACESAIECLSKLRNAFGTRLRTVIGDHELGKVALAGGQGGLRLESWHRCLGTLGLEPFWQQDIGAWRLMGITSSLAALPVYEKEVLPDEWPEWKRLREEHMSRIEAAFSSLSPQTKVVLFCHDPTALPFLSQSTVIQSKLAQVALTIIGHLHTQLVFVPSRVLAGLPAVTWMGPSIKRYTAALSRAREWDAFKPALCPALAGIELFKEGGYLRLVLHPEGTEGHELRVHSLPRRGLEPDATGVKSV